MGKETTSAGQGAVLLTVLGAVSQLLGFGYRVALARMVGAQVMGLYQLLMPMYAVVLSLTAVGLTAAVSNLTAQYLARGNARGADQALRACLKLFLLVLLPVGGWLIFASDFVSVVLLGDARTQLGLILLVPCVALTGVENFHKHWFYGAGLVRPPAVTELCEPAGALGGGAGAAVAVPAPVPGAGGGPGSGGNGDLRGVLRRHAGGALPPSPPGRSVRARRAGGRPPPTHRRHRPARGPERPAGQSAGGGQRPLSSPKSWWRGAWPGGCHRPAWGGVRHDAAHAGPAHGVLGGAESGAAAPVGPARALDRWDRVRQLAQRALSVVGVLALPAMAWMAVVGPTLGRLLFGRRWTAICCPWPSLWL